MHWFDHYVIDWDKVETVDDIKRIIAAIGIAFEPNNPNLYLIKDLVKRQDKQWPIPMPSPKDSK